MSSVSSDGLFMRFSGTASRVENAFHTGLASYRLANGTMGRATTSAPALPSTVSGSVTAVLGLTDLVHEQPGVIHRPTSATRTFPAAKAASFPHPPGSPTACSDASQAAIANGGLTDDQIGDAYGAFGLYKTGDFGAGQHIALYELEPFARSDIKTFDTCFFGASGGGQHARPAARDPGRRRPARRAGQRRGEPRRREHRRASRRARPSTSTRGRAPTATASIYDPVDPYVTMINTDRDQIISTSWGLCEQADPAGQPGLQQAENALFEQAAAQGQSVFSAAGDNGSDDCNTFETATPVAGQNPVSVDDPSSQPYVIAVGGTTIDDASTSRRSSRSGTTARSAVRTVAASRVLGRCRRGSGRRPCQGSRGREAPTTSTPTRSSKSFGFPQPTSASPAVPGATFHDPCRLVPDVSAQADEFTGAITVFEAAFGGWGTVRRHLIVDADLGGDARAGQRVGDVHGADATTSTASGSSARCCTRWRSNPGRRTGPRSTTSRPATTTSTA